jgi:hypothetical protein
MFKSPKEAFKDVVEHMEANKGNIRGLRLYAFSKSAGSDDLLLTDRGDALSKKRGEIEQAEVIELLEQYTQYIKYNDSPETNSSNTIGLEIILKDDVDESETKMSSLRANVVEERFLCDINKKDSFKDAIEYIESNKDNVKGLRFCAFSKRAGSDDLLLTDRGDVLSKKEGQIEREEVIYLVTDYTQYIKNNNNAEIKDSDVVGLYVVLKNEEDETVSPSIDIGSLEVKAPEMQFLCDVNETEAFCRDSKVV